MSGNASLIRAVQTGRRRLGLDDETYRGMLEAITGKRSAKELNKAQLLMVLNRMREAGFQEKSNQQMRLIRHLWLTMHDLGIVRDRRDSAIRAYIYRITKKTVGACEMADLSKVIETLKKWIDRLEDKEAQARLRREFVTMEPATPVIQ